ncbi:rho GTPase-activating protein 36-like [Puntigrus tetrazona]|uniref:rho GTPase-activating protein 36-like n=1 Tax=Puntigrus tetrazona TaxID=1606681 RepID=UPI001C89A3C8|nr:rho GTPase-activating protein 36-like [Puntigrus tetrazona]
MRQGLPLALTHMVEFVEKHGLSKIGLFIVGGSVQRCRDLKKGFDDGGFPERDSRDVDTWASLLKHFLKEIPGGLIPEPHKTQLLQVFRVREVEVVMSERVKHLPLSKTDLSDWSY